MRTTVTLDDDVAIALRRAALDRDTSFKQVLNDAVRRGLRSEDGDRPRYELPTFDLGASPDVDLRKALALSTSMEDDETLRRLALRK